jgi:hypothetical protein
MIRKVIMEMNRCYNARGMKNVGGGGGGKKNPPGSLLEIKKKKAIKKIGKP